MKKIGCLFLFTIFFGGFAFAQNQTDSVQEPAQPSASTQTQGWTPTWNVGDWWVVEFEYNASAYKSIAAKLEPNYQKVKVKYAITNEEVFDGKSVYRLQIKPERKVYPGPQEFIVFVSKERLAILKVQEIDLFDGTVCRSHVILAPDSSPFTEGWTFSIYTLPGFPLFQEPQTRFYTLNIYDEKTKNSRDAKEQQEISPVNIGEIPVIDEIKNIFSGEFLYKVKISNIVQVWSKKVTWFIYWEQNGIIGRLIDWKGKGV